MSEITIRKAIFEDFEPIMELLTELDNETDFTLFESGERKNNKNIQIALKEGLQKQKDQIIFVAINEESQLIGIIIGLRGRVNRQKHILYIVMGVKQQFWYQNIGSQLMQSLETWAIDNNFHRLELTVIEHNKKAISLYKKYGFKKEGIKYDSILLKNTYINEFYMSKLI
jgi:RimJ/RimL family protein N-acetyltransferase